VTTDHTSYSPGQTITATVEADTTLTSQQLRVEVDLIDSSGSILDGKEVDYTTSGSSNDPKTVTLTVPTGLASGTYTVRVLIFDAGTGQLQSTCQTSITVTGGGGGCNLTCSASVPATGTVGVPVSVTSTATTTGCTGVEYHWQFSDTTALYTGQNLSHTFSAAGVYNWNLWVHTNEQDCYKNGTITISGGGGSCTLSCSATVATTAQVNQSVSFQGSATPSNCGGAAVTYSWDFGDRTALASGQNVTHSYAAAGTYNWQMTAVVAGVYCVKNGTITVSSGGGGGCGGCAATRTLPGAYTPSQALQVTIQTCPPAGSNNHAVEDSPPSGWAVSGIDGGGTYDSANGKVKWGPFFDTQQRTLHYSVTPPAGTTGTKYFQGVISIDGVSQAICGSSSISAGSYHPADTDKNWRISIDEATAYGAAWKQGTTWPNPPNPIPIDYVTNAGYLWKSGEAYHYDASNTPPWVPGAPAAVAAAADAVQDSGVIALGSGSAIASFGASSYSAAVPLQVTIVVTPGSSTQVYAVEDAPPAGWTTSSIDNGGAFDTGTGKVKWGPFFDNVSRTLHYTVTPASGDVCPKTFVGVGSFDGSSFAIAGARTITSTLGGCAYSYWVPVVSHVDVPSKSAYYRSDTGVLNLAIVPANITARLYTGTTVVSMTSTVPANGQDIFQDIAGTLGFTTGSGALEVRSDQPLIVTSRTYNKEQGTGKTYGQGYDGVASASALTTGHSALLPQLTQSGLSGQAQTYRTNIGITNTGSTTASVTLAIFDEVGNQLWSDTKSYGPGVFYQYQEPFRTGAGRTNISKGYARVSVNSGSGIVAYASVLDNASSDPTTINTFDAASGGTAPYVYWVPVVSHVDVPSKNAYYRSDTGLLNLASTTASVTLRLYTGSSVLSTTRSVSALGQDIVQDIAGLLGFTTGSGALEVRSDQPLIVTSRTYNQEQGSGKTYGQGYDGITSAQGLAAGQSALLPQLVQDGVSGQTGTYRTNIGITNTGSTTASVTVRIYDAVGTQLWSDTKSYTPGTFYQYQEPYRTGAGRTNITEGYAKITVNSGSGVVAYASVLDNASSDPTTINIKRQ
jgi:PKD repeat protein